MGVGFEVRELPNLTLASPTYLANFEAPGYVGAPRVPCWRQFTCPMYASIGKARTVGLEFVSIVLRRSGCHHVWTGDLVGLSVIAVAS